MLNYKLVRSGRRTIAIHINKHGIEVRAPFRASMSDINRFVKSKQDWIDKHLSVIEQNMECKAAFSISYGDKALMQGIEYPIFTRQGRMAGFDGECFYFPPGLTPDEVKQGLIKVYKLCAKDLITKKVWHYAKQTGLIPSSVKITCAKTRWGSCSGKNSINFSWRLIMADDYVIDYVVVHELAHIREHNHSKRFWAVVESILPDYKTRQSKLKDLQKKLAREDWE